MRRALDEGRVSVRYQPQLACVTGGIVGLEPLVRCHEPGHGELAPVGVIRLAEVAGRVTDITEHVLATALPVSRHRS